MARSNTPWGPIQHTESLAPGIEFVSTAGHGGIDLARELWLQMPVSFREASENTRTRWFEEDCEYGFVVMCFPAAFPKPGTIEAARETVKNYFPDAYEAATGETLQPGESYIKDERAFYAAHRDEWLTVCAFGSWSERVPVGYVGVSTQKGGRCGTERTCRCFLIPEQEYEARDPRFSFIVDPARYEEIPSLR